MKIRSTIILVSLSALLMASCGAIPTLPPLDSTVTVWTPQATFGNRSATATGQVSVETVTETPAAVAPSATARATTTKQPVLPSATQTPRLTATKTPLPNTPTPRVTATPANTATATATSTPRPTSTPTAVPFALQLMNPYYLKNFTHADKGCAWLGVAGQIFSREGQVQKDIVIKAGGTINGKAVLENMTMPLAEPAVDLAYGPGGFEVTLATSTADTNSAVWIQLFSLSGDPLSAKINLKTYADCQKNLILLNFVEK